MTLCDLTAMYTQSPFGMYATYPQAYQTSSFSAPSFGAYPSVFNNTPVLDVFDSSTFGYTPTTSSCYIGQTGINPPYNVYPYPINTVPTYTGGNPFAYDFNYSGIINPFLNQNFTTTQYQTNYGYNFGSYTMPAFTMPIFTMPPLYPPLCYGGGFLGITSGGAAGSAQRTQRQQSSTGTSARRGIDWGNHLAKKPSLDKALELALSQVGVKEDNRSNDSAEIRKYKKGTKDNNPWCASFASWLFGSGQGLKNSRTFGYSASSQEIRRRAEKEGFYADKDCGYKPKVGDLMIIRNEKKPDKGHIGIITAINADGSFETIEGNYENTVAKVHRSMETKDLNGFVRMGDWLKAA